MTIKPAEHTTLMCPSDVCSVLVRVYLDSVYDGNEDNQELMEQIRGWQIKSGYCYGLKGLHDDLLIYAKKRNKEITDVEEKIRLLRKEVFNLLADEQRIKDSFRLYFTQFLSVLVSEKMYLELFKKGWEYFSADGNVEADLEYLPCTRYILHACLSFCEIYPDIDFSDILVDVYKKFTTTYIMTNSIIDPLYTGSSFVPSAIYVGEGESIMRRWTLYLGKKMGYDLDVDDFKEGDLEPGNTEHMIATWEYETLITKYPQLNNSRGKVDVI